MAKFVVKLELQKKNVPEKCDFGDHVHDEMTGNSNFATPSPTLVALQTASDDLRDAHTLALGGGFLLTADMHTKEIAWDLLMTAMGNYVDNVAMGSETIIKSAGMETKKLAVPFGTPAQVSGLSAETGVASGSVDLSWDRPEGAYVFAVFMKVDGEPDTSYRLVAIPSAKKVTITGLQPTNRYWFKVEAVGRGNKRGEASEPASAQAAL